MKFIIEVDGNDDAVFVMRAKELDVKTNPNGPATLQAIGNMSLGTPKKVNE